MQRSTIQRFTALLFVLIFLAGSMAHVWHHCCDGGHSTREASGSSFCHASDLEVEHGSNFFLTSDQEVEHGSIEACCGGHHDETITSEEAHTESGSLATCLALMPGERAVIHHHHHQCCDHNLSPLIDEAVVKNVINTLTINLSQLPFICFILPEAKQPFAADSPPSTLVRTGRQLLASHCVLRR